MHGLIPTTIPEAMAEQLREVGFDMQIETLDWNYVYESINADDYDAGIEWLSWAEPDADLQRLLL